MSTQDTRFETVLDSCLADVRRGRASVEDCLARYPDLAARLEALLRTAARLQAVPQPTLTKAARQRIEAQLYRRLEAQPVRGRSVVTQPSARPRLSLTGMLRWAATVALTIALLTVFTSGGIRASDSLPGETMYTFKTVGERIEAWFTPDNARAEMHLKFAERRLDEVMTLGHLGIVDDLALIRMEAELRQVMELLPTLPLDQRQAVIEAALSLTQRQHTVLISLTHYTPPISQAGLEWSIDSASRRAQQLEEALD